MQNWKKTRNYRKFENSEGSFTYTITVDGKRVEVSKEIYAVYAGTERKLEYTELDLKRDRVLQDAKGRAVLDENGQPIALPEREVSLDKLIAEDWDYPSSEPPPEQIFFAAYESEEAKLARCLERLTNDERALIDALHFEGLTQKEYALRLGIKQPSVNERYRRILKKIKIFWS